MTRNRQPILMAALGVVVAGLSTLALVNMKPQPAEAAPVVGEAAPAFAVQDTSGKVRTLDEFKGKYVVLEWLNHGCPFVKKHYNSGNMQKLQADFTKDGVVWLSVNSSREGQQGHETPAKTDEITKSKNASPSAVLLDNDYKMAHAYSAKTTPHMFLISPEGKVLYNGAIDDKKSTDVEDVKTAKNYLTTAYQQAKNGEAITTPSTQPYGCSVKY